MRQTCCSTAVILVTLFVLPAYGLGSEIRGRVSDQSGKAIPGALVEWGAIDDAPERRDRAISDGDGEYQLTVTRFGVGYRLGVWADGYAPVWNDHYAPWNHHREVSDKDAVPPAEKDFVLEPGHTLTGLVVDEGGEPIPDVLVKARTSVNGFDSSFSSPSWPTMIPGDKAFEAKTDARGEFEFDGLPATSVNLNLTARHRHVNDQNYVVDIWHRIVMSGSGRPGRIRAHVIDQQTAQPIEDFTVARRYIHQQRKIRNPDGQFEWDDLTAEREYELHFYARGYAPWRQSLKAVALDNQDTSSVTLSPGHPLLARLFDADTREPVVEAPVLFGVLGDARYFEWGDWDKYIDGLHGLTWVQRAVTDQAGHFWFCEDVQAGTLFIFTKGYARAIIRPEDRPAADPGGMIQIALHPEATIEGTLIENNQPISNADMQIYREQPRQQPEENFEKTTTDEDGHFRFAALEPGTYQLGLGRRLSRWTTKYQRLAKIELGQAERKVVDPLKISPDEQ